MANKHMILKKKEDKLLNGKACEGFECEVLWWGGANKSMNRNLVQKGKIKVHNNERSKMKGNSIRPTMLCFTNPGCNNLLSLQ